jgi:glutamyl-tRNA reductase
MSPIARALHEKFDEVCRMELQRLRRKTASLTAAERAEVDAMSVAVTQAIAARVEAALECQEGPELTDMVARLFAVMPQAAGHGEAGRVK